MPDKNIFMHILTLSENDIAVALPVILAAVAFIIYWFTTLSERIKKFFYRKYDSNTGSVYHIFFTKIFGFTVMGLIPLLMCLWLIPSFRIADYGITFRADTFLYTILWTAGLCVIVVPVTLVGARKPANLANYPQIRAKIWTRKTIFIAAAGWTLYLLGYETLFRGVLLMPVADQIGIWPAIAVNTALYSATHVPKGLNETIGAIPLGIVLCLVTLFSGTIWIAFIVHLVMAWTNCFASLKYNPEMIYKRKV